jgi:hypothetical protein
MRTLAIALLLLAALAAPAAAQAATPGQAARVTGRCFRAEGWKATVRGATVKATSPRLRPPNNFPRRPSIEVRFFESFTGRLATVQVINALNDSETRTAKHCVNRGKRA